MVEIKNMENTKQKINWFDTPLQRRRYGDLAVNIMSKLLGLKRNFNNFGIEIDLIPKVEIPKQNNNK